MLLGPFLLLECGLCGGGLWWQGVDIFEFHWRVAHADYLYIVDVLTFIGLPPACALAHPIPVVLHQTESTTRLELQDDAGDSSESRGSGNGSKSDESASLDVKLHGLFRVWAYGFRNLGL